MTKKTEKAIKMTAHIDNPNDLSHEDKQAIIKELEYELLKESNCNYFGESQESF